MKALFISNDASLPDVASATHQRMQAYAEAIGELHILLRSSRSQRMTDGAITIHEVAVNKLIAPFTLSKHAQELIKKEHIDIVSTQDPFEHGWAGARAVRGTTAKLHVQIHTDFLSPWFVRGFTPASLLNRARLLLADWVLRRVDGIRVVSKRIQRALVRDYGTDIPGASVIPILLTESEKGEDTAVTFPFSFTLLAASRFEQEKRIPDILRAVAVLRERYPGLGLVLAGDGRKKRSLKRLARTLGIEGRVRFLGWRTNTKEIMRSAHAFIQTSAYEGYGLSLLQSARAGTPIITSNVGIVGEVFTPNVDLLVFEVGDLETLQRHIETLIASEERCIQLAKNAHQAAAVHLMSIQDQPLQIAKDLEQTLGRQV